jgi:hypothetical protein
VDLNTLENKGMGAKRTKSEPVAPLSPILGDIGWLTPSMTESTDEKKHEVKNEISDGIILEDLPYPALGECPS